MLKRSNYLIWIFTSLLISFIFRVLGALLSAHLLIEDEEKDFGDLRPLWYSNQLLYLSEELATKLLPAFDDSFSGLPHPRVIFSP